MNVEGSAAEPAPALAASPDQLLETLYRRYAAWLEAKLRRRYGRGVADDLVHETYIRLAPYQQGREIRHPQALLWTIAQNIARNQHRRTRGAVAVSVNWEDALDHEAVQPAEQFEALLLQDVVLQLPFELRQVFVLSRFSGMTNDEIARRCGVSIATVERRLAKALELCAKSLGR